MSNRASRTHPQENYHQWLSLQDANLLTPAVWTSFGTSPIYASTFEVGVSMGSDGGIIVSNKAVRK